MIGIVVVTHGNLAIELVSAVNFVLSQEPEVKIVGVTLNPKKKFDSFTKLLRKLIMVMAFYWSQICSVEPRLILA